MEDDTAGTNRIGSVARFQNDWERDDPTTAVVESVAAAAECDVESLGPLYDRIDPDALNALFGGGVGSELRVQLRYEGYEVTLYADGLVTVRAAAAGDR